MSARWRKEFLLLAPAWATAMLVAFGAPQLGRLVDSLPFVLFAVAIVVLAVTSFGREHSLKTYPLLLSAPVPRLRLWRDKVILLVVAETTVAVCFWSNVCWLPPSVHVAAPITPAQLAWAVLLMTAVAIGGALWITQTVRDLLGAILVTVLLPFGVVLAIALVQWALESFTACRWLVGSETVFVSTFLGLYASAGFAHSIRLFLRAEATPSALEREIEFRRLPQWLHRQRASTSPLRRPRPIWALVAKELHLQQFILLGVAAGTGLGLACCALAALLGDAHREQVRGAVAGCTAIMAFTTPWLVGLMAIAEEKRTGTLNAQHCLPVTRWRTFLVKLICAEAVSVAASGVLVGMLLLLAAEPSTTSASQDLLTDWVWLGVICPLAATAVALYASSATDSPLKAIGLALVVGALFAYALGKLATFDTLLRFWDTHYLVLIGLAIELGFLWWRSWRNYRGGTHGWRPLCGDALAFLLVGSAAVALLFELSLLL